LQPGTDRQTQLDLLRLLFEVSVYGTADLGSMCQGNVGECPRVAILFCVLEIAVCFVSNLGSLVSCFYENGGRSLPSVLPDV
jgi:hypothetical protein